MKKKNLAASEWQNFLLFPSPCKQRRSFFSSSDIFSILFFLCDILYKKCAVIVR